MKALIDCDIIQHEFGSATDGEYKTLAWPLVQARVQGRINGILDDTGADSYQLYLTSDDKSNFRYSAATIQPYKGNRSGLEKPHWYTHIRNLLVDFRGAIEVFGQEADDAMAIAQVSLNKKGIETVICTLDKDLHMVPGLHYSWRESKNRTKEIWRQDELEGLKCFYCQLLTGDSVDNILGLYGVGAKSASLSRVHSCNSESDMYHTVLEEYQKRFGSYAEQFILENGRLLWMRQEEGQMWEPPKDE
jgi:hypothetical protein